MSMRRCDIYISFTDALCDFITVSNATITETLSFAAATNQTQCIEVYGTSIQLNVMIYTVHHMLSLLLLRCLLLILFIYYVKCLWAYGQWQTLLCY